MSFLNADSVISIWDKYVLPDKKRIHVRLVAAVSMYISNLCMKQQHMKPINTELLRIAALFHDIDKAVQKNPGERHPDTAVRIVQNEGFPEAAKIIQTHVVDSVLHSLTRPKTIEEKIVYLSDKMCVNEVISVDERFERWMSEPIPEAAKKELISCYPYAKDIEKEIFALAHTTARDIRDAMTEDVIARLSGV